MVSLPQFTGNLKPWVGVVKRMEGRWVVDTGEVSITLWSEIEKTEILGNMFENPDLIADDREITGNIYENPELLEETE